MLDGAPRCPSSTSDRNGDDVLGAKIASCTRRNLRDQSAIGEAARADFNGLKQARKSTARADGFAEISVRENNRFAVRQVCRHHGHGNPEIFEALRFEHLLDEVA